MVESGAIDTAHRAQMVVVKTDVVLFCRGRDPGSVPLKPFPLLQRMCTGLPTPSRCRYATGLPKGSGVGPFGHGCPHLERWSHAVGATPAASSGPLALPSLQRHVWCQTC